MRALSGLAFLMAALLAYGQQAQSPADIEATVEARVQATIVDGWES